MRITLTPGQAVSIHGWWRARTGLTWGDVLLNEGLTFSKLRLFNIGEQELHVLQPDLQAWIRAGKAVVGDCPRMKAWDAHPIRDFKADLADLVGVRWPHDTLTRMGVTHDDLLLLGLTPETMNLFGFTLRMWAAIGFERRHAELIPPNTLFHLFSMSKQDILASLH
jgi:hypothetical protein